MIFSLDTNIIAGIWSGTPEGRADRLSLQTMQKSGQELMVCGVVYAELAAYPGMDRGAVDTFLEATAITLDLQMPEAAWQAAADANHAYQLRRRRSGGGAAKRVLPDFLIGAHALHRAAALMTRNPGDVKDFPTLVLVVPEL